MSEEREDEAVETGPPRGEGLQVRHHFIAGIATVSVCLDICAVEIEGTEKNGLSQSLVCRPTKYTANVSCI